MINESCKYLEKYKIPAMDFTSSISFRSIMCREVAKLTLTTRIASSASKSCTAWDKSVAK